jgi:hypothetical protein
MPRKYNGAERASIVEQTIQLLLNGKSLKTALAEVGINPTVLHDWLTADRCLANQYAHAQLLRADVLADEVLEIADTDPDAMRARNRIDARKWFTGKTHSAKYGERVDLQVTMGLDVRGALEEARARARSIGDQSSVVDAQIVGSSGDSGAGLIDTYSRLPLPALPADVPEPAAVRGADDLLS